MGKEGWTKHHRKKWEKGYHKDHLLWVLMDYFIDHANYQDGEVFFPNIGIIPLKRGQHMFGTHKLAEFMGVGRQRIRTKLKKLEKIGFLTIEPTNKYSIATIINYNKYQSSENETNQQTNQHLTSSQPALNQQLTTHKNRKESKKVKKGKNIKYKSSPPIPKKIEYPEWLNSELWNEFKEHRIEIKSPMTIRAEKKNLKELKKLIDQGFNQNEIINHSIACGYRGLFPVKKSGVSQDNLHNKIKDVGKKWLDRTAQNS